MKAIILSAGQGKRLHPYTDNTPKCLLPVRGDQPVLEVQLRALAECGVAEAVVFVGFGAEKVEDFVARRAPSGIEVSTVFNPFYAVSDNLATCWLAREHMRDEFIILNGDTLFEATVVRRLMAAPQAPLTLAINQKDAYDDDDMKVSLSKDGSLVGVGKTLEPRIVDGESIGLMLFSLDGAESFREVIDRAIRREDATSLWYLSIVNEMSQECRVATVAITGLWWGELDCPKDLAALRAHLNDEPKEESRTRRALFARA
jgi:choline kinase